jgi:outer membrane protein OmpA-like peptidoglycan-associated protein
MKAPELYATAMLLALFTSPAAAQGAGTIEFGAFGQASYFDKSLRFDQAKGGPGVRLGIFALPSIEIEAEGAFVPVDGRPTDTPDKLHIYYMPLRARLLLNLRSGEHGAFLLGGGFVRNEYRHDIRFHDNGVTGLVGARLGLPGNTNIRLATYADYIPSPSNGVGYQLNWGIQVGLGFLLGGGGSGNGGEAHEKVTPVKGRPDSLAMAAQRDSLARIARQDSLRMQAARDSAAQAARVEQNRIRDSVSQAQQKAQAAQQALRDSVNNAARQDSIRTAALRDSLRLTQNRARIAALRDSLARVALRDSLRMLMTQRQARVTLRGVNFELGKAVLLPISRDILQDVARSLVSNPTVRVEVGGHTDSTGSRAVNERLSLARAESVKAFLIENGVNADQMEVKGYASTQPVASNKTKSGRAQNRRVELRRIE